MVQKGFQEYDVSLLSHEVSALNSVMPRPNLEISNQNIRECSQRGSGDSGQKWEDGRWGAMPCPRPETLCLEWT